jgi:hypothetical protein
MIMVTPEQIVDSLFEVANQMKNLLDDTYDEKITTDFGKQLDEIYAQYQATKQ